MFERLVFYVRHSLNDLQANLFRTIFVIVSIAVGVGAVVSLQNLGVMIDSTLTGNLQEQNRGDLALTILPEIVFSDDDVPETNDPDAPFQTEFSPQIRRGIREGAVSTYESTGLGFEQPVLVEGAISVLDDWMQNNYDGDYEITFNSYAAGDSVGIIFGSAPGAYVINQSNTLSATQQTAVFIDPEIYPFYDEIFTQDDKPLSELLATPRNIVLSEKTAVRLEADVGDTLRLQKMDGEFRVAGIVDDSAEIRNPITDFFLGIFGYYYMNVDALRQFGDVDEVRLTALYVKLDDPDPEQVETLATEINNDLPYLEVTTTEDIRELNESVSDVLSDILKAIGLLALVLGSIGIINTMQVVVRKRTLEIGVLKTIGLKGRQITVMFLVQALLLGIIGSVVGTLLGSVFTLSVRQIGEALTGQELEFTVALDPIANGIIVGVIVTTIFGFLPTLSAAKVRPNVVLRPQEAIAPRSGIFAMLITLVISVLILALTVMNVMDLSFLYSAGVVGAVFGTGIALFPVLWVTIWFVARFAPRFRSPGLDMAKHQIRNSKSRSAVTLLALVIGIFALSSITLFADAFASLIDNLLAESVGGRSVIVQIGNPEDADQAERIIEANDDVEDYVVEKDYETRVVSINLPDGREITYRDILVYRNRTVTDPNSELAFLNNIATFADSRLTNLNAFNLDGINEGNNNLIRGRHLNETDIANPGIVLVDAPWIDADTIPLGTKITFEFSSAARVKNMTFTVVGFVDQSNIGEAFDDTAFNFVLVDAIPPSVTPDQVIFNVRMPSDKVATLQRDMQAIPDSFVFDLRVISTLIDAIVSKFAILPTIFGVVGLIVGAVVIANSVALSTLERRRDIAVLKAIGLKRFGVLRMILAENALLGLVGALLGVGFGVISLAVFDYFEDEIDVQINWWIAGGMTALSIGIAMLAALVASWGASGEKPLNVLRYE